MDEIDELLDDVMSDELTEGDEAVDYAVGSGSAPTTPSQGEPERASPPSVSIIKTPEDVPAALERVTHRRNVDLDWLKRRAGKKKK